jgi:hypothetical protein
MSVQETAEVVSCFDTGVPALGGAHVPDLSSLEGETATCVRCGAQVVGNGPYEMQRWDEPDPPAGLRWILLDRASNHVGYVEDEALARRVAALLNFAHREEQAP